MAEAELTFAKIVSSPSSVGWSQVYSAGKLFAAISLEKKEELEEKDYLNVVGKEILNTLEQEFFILEKKDLDSIREAVLTTSKKIPQDSIASFVIGSVVGNILYVYIVGDGRADIKRGEKIGTILQASDQQNDSIKEVSGFLQDGDVVVLQTRSFSDVISENALLEFLENPSIIDAAENLAPVVAEKNNALAACIMTGYKELIKESAYNEGEKKIEDTPSQEGKDEDQKPSDENEDEEKSSYFTADDNLEQDLPKTPALGGFLNRIKRPRLASLTHTRKIILTIVVIIVIIFATSIFFALQKQQNDKLAQEFSSIFPRAEKKYEEGISLADLNQALARDSFLSAKSILEQGKDDFPPDSDYSKQILELLAKVNTQLGSSPVATQSNAKEVKAADSFYLSEVLGSKALYFTLDENIVYFIDDKTISSITKGASSSKTLVENDNDWKSVGGLATYNTNLYVLDKDQNQILKFVNSGSQYSKSNYFPQSIEPDFGKAVAIAIDNNVYVLFSDGTVAKYFKGQASDFSLKGLDKPLSSPSRIYANPDFDNIYVLDNGNSRVVVFDKSGNFKGEYQSPVVKAAKDFEVLEKDKKIFVLSSGKIYQIDLK